MKKKKDLSELTDEELMRLKLYEPDGAEIRSFGFADMSPITIRKKRGELCTLRTGLDPRYGRISDLDTGAELYVRHSSRRGPYQAIQLKKVGQRSVLLTLAHYDKRSVRQFYAAVAEADNLLAEMAGLPSVELRMSRS